MNPVIVRASILVTELTVFFTMTVVATFLISHASALRFEVEEAPPDGFPVLVHAGDRQRPAAADYRIVPWKEWPGFAAAHPGASLVPPEESRKLQLGDDSRASFTKTLDGAVTTIDLSWTVGTEEQQTRYVVNEAHIVPLYYRTMGGRTFLMGAVVGFLIGVIVGRAMRRRLLYAAPPA